jgi:quercetin dioxygenase-like cupin family protein
MPGVMPVNPPKYLFDISRNLAVTTRASKPGAPERIDGMTIGVITLEQNPPHGGEMHPDGDEILYVISGKLMIISDSSEPLVLGPGNACIIEKGEWHRVELIEKAQLIHITPGPNGDHRPLQDGGDLERDL